MHPTYRRTPPLPPAPLRSELAVARQNLLGLADATTHGRNAFLVGFLRQTIVGLVPDIIDPAARTRIARALALVEAHNELMDEEDAFLATRIDGPVDPTKVPHEGISCGRYAR